MFDSYQIKGVILRLENVLVLSKDRGKTVKSAPGAAQFLQYLQHRHIQFGIVSTFSKEALRDALAHLQSSGPQRIAPVVCRDDRAAGHSVLACLKKTAAKLNTAQTHLLLVSNRQDDLDAAGRMGALSVFYRDTNQSTSFQAGGGTVISGFEDLIQLVRMGVPLPAGKLPNDLLRQFLDQFVFDDPAILINPGVGEDTAAVDVTPDEVLVLKSDPITFATDSIGQYAVLVNANDIVTSGAVPRWLLTTLLFPTGVTPSEIRKVVNELKAFCQNWRITLCGGHTEITDAVVRPIVTGMMAGTVRKSNLIDKRNMKPGDAVLLTKSVAVEGTAIIAREFRQKLIELGISNAEIERCRNFLSNISIISEAQIAAQSKGISAMHDVTEGGLATALLELSDAGEHRIRVDMQKVPVYKETRKICRALDINPLGLIGSGSLLICCHPQDKNPMMRAIRQAGIDVTTIGEIQARGIGIDALLNGKTVPWPEFEVDEITKLYRLNGPS